MRSYTVGSVFGIPIKLDVTFLLVLPAFAALIGWQTEQWVSTLNSVWALGLPVGTLSQGATPWLLGIAAAVGLFACVLLHELGHSVVSMHYGYPIESITLWLLGGVANLEEQPEDWKQELLIAIAGPVVSVALGAVSYAALLVVRGTPPLTFVVGYLALANVVLAVFNLLPGFPMDGGRVLRALLARTRPYARATQLAAEVGKAVAVILGILGLFGNLLLIAIAFFIYIGASSESQRTVMNAAFEGVTVADVMTDAADVKTVHPDDTVTDLTERMFEERHTGYPVVQDGRVVGVVTLGDAREVEPVERDAYTVGDVMTRDVRTTTPDAEAMDALERIQDEGIGRLIVVDDDGRLLGLVSRTDLMTAFNIIQSAGRGTQTPAPKVDADDRRAP
ncbi:Zn-dependent protease/CBS domain-containing protein [Halarchaeum rubridurum]|uniref:Zinc metalloprotease n=1 Tax=Halarchaeum rubridurum TaxID=489911 RepID=A0A830FTB8_9EURY|nr:M50 family metallopeptidase [Halarchaeum rubridurum]MBP1954200.1 Zn-dependent protease/CBS domain-containing protein [Halarchaeum rubridurum]GGM58117.1 metalloprotease [Halarchaeum rubridurum]